MENNNKHAKIGNNKEDAVEEQIVEACEQIDAAMFSGDQFMDAKARSQLRQHMLRWENELKYFDEIQPTGFEGPEGEV
jgi:hypothetical protein